MKIGIFLRNLGEIVSEFHEHFQKMKTFVENCRKLKILDIRSMFVKFRQNFIKISKKNTNFHAFFMKIWMNNYSTYSKMTKLWRLFCWNFEIWAVQKYENLVDPRSLKNEYLDAKIGVDTAENEPSKVSPACLRAWRAPSINYLWGTSKA